MVRDKSNALRAAVAVAATRTRSPRLQAAAGWGGPDPAGLARRARPVARLGLTGSAAPASVACHRGRNGPGVRTRAWIRAVPRPLPVPTLGVDRDVFGLADLPHEVTSGGVAVSPLSDQQVPAHIPADKHVEVWLIDNAAPRRIRTPNSSRVTLSI